MITPYSCEDLEVQTNSCLVADLKTPPLVPYKSAADLSAPSLKGGDVTASRLTTSCSADLVSHGTSLGRRAQAQRINKSQPFSLSSVQSSMLESSEIVPTPPIGPTLQSPSLSLDKVSAWPQCNLPSNSHYLEQLDFCFDSQLSPAPAPAPGQGFSYDQNNNQEQESKMMKTSNNNQDGRALCSERYTTSNLKIPRSQELVSAVDDTNNSKLLNQRDNTVFKTDLSKFYSSTPLSVAPAVQSGQNIIPAMVKTRRSTFFWNTEKNGWNKVKDESLVKPNIVRSWNSVQYQGNIVLPSKGRTRNMGIEQYGKDEKNITFPRPKRNIRRKAAVYYCNAIVIGQIKSQLNVLCVLIL